MKVQLLSDLHLETQPNWRPSPAPDADVTVLAGDIGSYQAGHQMADADFGLSLFSPLAGWPTPVIFVPGNHEYDGFDFDEVHARLQACCARLGLIWLERQTFCGPWQDRQGRPVRFVGTTLWSDFDALAPAAMPAQAISTRPGKAANASARKVSSGSPQPHTSPELSLLSRQLQARDKAYRAANYYLKKTGTTRGGEPFLGEAVRAQALQCQQWLRSTLAEPFDGSTVAVTHFAPSLRSADPRYGLSPGTAGFCNALDDLLAHANVWLHGHLHAPSLYEQGGCRVWANPLGYARKNEQLYFQPHGCIEI